MVTQNFEKCMQLADFYGTLYFLIQLSMDSIQKYQCTKFFEFWSQVCIQPSKKLSGTELHRNPTIYIFEILGRYIGLNISNLVILASNSKISSTCWICMNLVCIVKFEFWFKFFQFKMAVVNGADPKF